MGVDLRVEQRGSTRLSVIKEPLTAGHNAIRAKRRRILRFRHRDWRQGAGIFFRSHTRVLERLVFFGGYERQFNSPEGVAESGERSKQVNAIGTAAASAI